MSFECMLPDQVEFENLDEIHTLIRSGFEQADTNSVIINCEAIKQVNSLLLAVLIEAINQSRSKSIKLKITAVPEALYGFCGDANLVEVIRQFSD